jgi:hypothetical protein
MTTVVESAVTNSTVAMRLLAPAEGETHTSQAIPTHCEKNAPSAIRASLWVSIRKLATAITIRGKRFIIYRVIASSVINASSTASGR